MTETLKEIGLYLHSEDISLARRRILDAAYNTRNPLITRQTIEWSRAIRNAGNSIPQELKNQGEKLLAEIESVFKNMPPVTEKNFLIKASQISKTYAKGNFKLHPIDIEIGYGDIWGIVGENGNGKTTLLRCLAGQLMTDEGEIRYYFMKEGEADPYLIKQQVAFIPQRIPKWFGQLKDNLHFSATISGLFDEANDLMVDFMLERLDLADYAHLTWDQISSGYRTRFEIARILIQRPRLLILDEPLANLDINAQQILLNDLKHIASSGAYPMGIILSSQQLHEVEKIANNVIFIKKGSYIFSTSDAGTEKKEATYTIEIETTAKKNEIEEAFANTDPQLTIRFNGGVYLLESKLHNPETMLTTLIEKKIKINYYRDITHSTKKYFNL